MTQQFKHKTLILFTNIYPFGKANEIYIDNEIEYLTSTFKKVIIVPAAYTKNSRLNQPNVEVFDINKYSKFSKWRVVKYFRVFILCLIHEARNKHSGGILFNIKKIYNAILYADCLKSYLSENKISATDTVLYSYWFYHWALVCAIVKYYNPGVKAVSRAHLNDLYCEFNNDQFTFTKLKYLDNVFPISQHGTNYLTNKYPQFNTKIKTQYLGVNDLGINKTEFNNENFVIVSCSVLRKDKRIDKIIEALSYLQFPVTWIHFGHGPLLNDIRELSKTLPNNITADIRGFVENKEVQQFYSTAPINLFVNFSSAEGIPVSIMEVISCGIPVLATSVYGTPESVTDNVGELIDVNYSSLEVAKKIIEFKYSYKNTIDYRVGVRAHWDSRFNARKNYPDFLKDILS